MTSETKLILIEGFPGAGKSTTCEYLGTYFQKQKITCKWYRETDQEHPLDFSKLKLKELSEKLPPLWKALVDRILSEEIMVVVESRLWQNTALFMYMSEYSNSEILEVHQLVWRELAEIAPSLIYLYQPNVEKSMQRLYNQRDREIVERDIEFTSQYPWFKNRGLSSFAGWIEFFTAWQKVTEYLYQDFPYKKVKIENLHENWDQSYQQMLDFLKSA